MENIIDWSKPLLIFTRNNKYYISYNIKLEMVEPSNPYNTNDKILIYKYSTLVLNFKPTIEEIDMYLSERIKDYNIEDYKKALEELNLQDLTQ